MQSYDLPNYKNVNLYVLSEVLYYLNNPNRELLLSKISNSLEINGLVLFTARIGEKYFIEDSALKLLSKYFNIVNTNYIYCKFYHFINYIPSRILLLDAHIKDNNDTKLKTNLLRRSIIYIVKLRLLKYLLIPICILSEFIVKNKTIPSILNTLCGFLNIGKSNLVIFAKKRK